MQQVFDAQFDLRQAVAYKNADDPSAFVPDSVRRDLAASTATLQQLVTDKGTDDPALGTDLRRVVLAVQALATSVDHKDVLHYIDGKDEVDADFDSISKHCGYPTPTPSPTPATDDWGVAISPTASLGSSR